MTLTKYDLVEKTTETLNIEKKDATNITETLLELLKGTLVKGDDITISGFGRWEVKSKNKRKGRNPATGETMILPARKVVIFRWSEKLKDMVN